MHLTEAGQLLAEHAEVPLQRVETGLADLMHPRAGRLWLAACPSAGTQLVPDAIGAFRRAYSDVQLSLDIRRGRASTLRTCRSASSW